MNRRIMYVCDPCLENNPEASGHFDRDELRVVPDGRWMCDSCYEFEYERKLWHLLPMPPEYIEVNEMKSSPEPMTEEEDSIPLPPSPAVVVILPYCDAEEMYDYIRENECDLPDVFARFAEVLLHPAYQTELRKRRTASSS